MVLFHKLFNTTVEIAERAFVHACAGYMMRAAIFVS
jgi:hypothetical protein